MSLACLWSWYFRGGRHFGEGALKRLGVKLLSHRQKRGAREQVDKRAISASLIHPSPHVHFGRNHVVPCSKPPASPRACGAGPAVVGVKIL